MENLRDLNIRAVSLHGMLPNGGSDSASLTDVLSGHEARWPRRAMDKTGLYEVEEVQHHTGLEVELNRRPAPGVISFTLGAHPFPRNENLRQATRERQNREFNEIQSILTELARSDLKIDLTARIAWRFPPDSRKPIVSLPLMSIQSPNVPFTEISGVRFKRRSADGLTSVIIDLEENRSLVTTLAFPLPKSGFSTSMVDDAVLRGAAIIEEFVMGPGLTGVGKGVFG